MVDFAGFTGVPPPRLRAPGMRVARMRPLQSLKHEMGGVKIYEAALKCVVNEDLKEEWEKYHQETERHVQILQDVFSQMQLDANEQTPGRKIVHDMGQSLVKAMEAASCSPRPRTMPTGS
jgi:rubrerythrin